MILYKSGGATFSDFGFGLGVLTGIDRSLIVLLLNIKAFLQGGDSPPLTKVGLLPNLPLGVAGGESSSSEEVIGSQSIAKNGWGSNHIYSYILLTQGSLLLLPFRLKS